MSNTLTKVSVVLLLLLGIAGAFMAYLLFDQRETIKGRTQKLESALIDVAKTVEVSDDSQETIKLVREELKVFKATPDGPQVTMDTPLNRLRSASQAQLDRLNTTRNVLSDTRDTLAQTKETLEETRSDLQDARDNITELNSVIVSKNNIIEEKESNIRSLEDEKSELNATISDQSLQITDLTADNKQLTDKVSELEQENKKLIALLDKGGGGPREDLKGRLGEVLYVDPEWNFCIFSVGDDRIKDMLPNYEMLIHRGDDFVSKVKITKVVEPFVIAEIMSDWQQKELRKGDNVIY